MIHLLLLSGLLGLATSTLYAGMAAVGAVRFACRRRVQTAEFTPAVSLLKPLHGEEPALASRLQSFFEQDYPVFEILFCARSNHDPALMIARVVAARYPQVPTRFLSCGEPPYANAKVWSLQQMFAVASHPILVVSDSDVSVDPGYLRAIVRPLADQQTGMVTCLYRGVALPRTYGGARSVWSHLEAVGMSVEMSSGVLVAEMLEGMQFALGPTMVVRRQCLEEAGGFASIGDHHGDDFMLGKLIAAQGRRVVLSTYTLEHHVLNSSFTASASHQVRWLRGTRFYRPWGHFGTLLTFGLPFGVLTTVVAWHLHEPRLAVFALAWSWTMRVALAALVSRLVVQEQAPWRCAAVFPFRDCLGFLFWIASYLGDEVVWRGEVYELLRGGLMRKKDVAMRQVGSEDRGAVPSCSQ